MPIKPNTNARSLHNADLSGDRVRQRAMIRPPFGTDDRLLRASSRLGDAEAIGASPQGNVVRDRIGGGDREDFYRFRIRERSLVTITLRRLSSNADLLLLDRRGRTIERSNNAGTSSEIIIRPFTRTGVYYVRVLNRSKSTGYRLEVAAIPRSRLPGNGDEGGSPQQPATDIFLDIDPGSGSSNPRDLVVVDNFLYFAANDGVNGRELFRTDGTTTTRIDINTTALGADSDPRDLLNINGTLYFSADDGVRGRELFRITNSQTDATLVSDINPTVGVGSDPRGLINFNNVLYFSASSGTLGGRELFRSDGTTAGTFRVSDINPGSGSSSPTDFAVVGNFLYFAATTNITGRELFRSDGTTNINSTVAVADLNIGFNTGIADSSNPTDLINVNNVLYFAATGDQVGRELWRYDPLTGAAPIVVANIATDPAGSSPGTNFNAIANSLDPVTDLNDLLFDRPNRSAIVSINNVLYFAATGNTIGRELFRSDGITGANRSAPVSDINVGATDGVVDSSTPTNLTTINGVLYFAATGDVLGNELYRYNPAAGATALPERVSDVNPGDAGSDPAEFVLFNNRLIFVGTTLTRGRELRVLTGTP